MLSLDLELLLTLEVRKLRSDLSMPPDPSNVLLEGHAIKGFQTFINKRLFVSKNKREPG